MNPLRAWNRFWFTPISARPLGAFRIVFGLIVLANLALLTVDFDYWLTDAGLIQGSEARAVAAPLRYSVLQWVQDPTSVRLFFGATAVLAVLVTVGWHTRTAAILLYLAQLMIHHRNIGPNSGADGVLMVLTFYLMLTPCGAAYSLDARRAARRRGTPAEPLILPWSQRLIQIQLCVIYLATAILKCHGSTWLNGTALHFVLNNSEIGRFRLNPLSQYPIAVNLLTHGGLAIEFVLPFLLWFRPTRRWAIAAGVSLHAGILLLVNIPLFGELMTACYLTFLDPDELDALLRALDPRRWSSRAARTPAALPPRTRQDGPGAIGGPHVAVAAEVAAGSPAR